MTLGTGRNLYDVTAVTSVWADTPEQARQHFDDGVTILNIEPVMTDDTATNQPRQAASAQTRTP